MDANKVREVLIIYREKFEEMGVPIKEFDLKRYKPSNDESLAHCHAMTVKAITYLKDGSGSVGKAKRWIGFIQHAFWIAGVYNIEEEKFHSRP